VLTHVSVALTSGWMVEYQVVMACGHGGNGKQGLRLHPIHARPMKGIQPAACQDLTSRQAVTERPPKRAVQVCRASSE
jgi:hypothetical protein